MLKKSVRYLVQAALIAALYAALTLALQPISFSATGQVRVSEALTVLPFFTPAAVPGLFVGCLLANLIGGYGILDIVFGSLATLLAALAARKLRRWPFLVPLPSVLFNAAIVGPMLSYVTGFPMLPTVGYVGLGQLAACYVLGLPLLYLLRRYDKILFRMDP